MKLKWVLAILIIFILFISIPFQKAIVIEAGHSGKVLGYFPIQKKDKTFHILFTHSIHLSDVKETYNVLNNGNIRLTELMYEDTSIGMPSNAEEGETFELIDGKYYIRNMNRDFPFIYLRVGQVIANHQLIVHGKKFELSSILEPGSLVKIRERQLALWHLWKGVKIVGR